MLEKATLYIDDSGTRHKNHKARRSDGHDWFALGGVILAERDQNTFRARHRELQEKWGFTAPLHSSEIRNRTGNFGWLRRLTRERLDQFLGDVQTLATRPELTALACVVDRSGYDRRYEHYGPGKWSMCKAAFSIVVERAVKFARRRGERLRVYVERSDRKTDRRVKGYYEELRRGGLPFNSTNSARYSPLEAVHFRETLFEFRTKDKSSPPMQIADLCVYPIARGGYEPDYKPFVALREAGTLIDCKVDDSRVAEVGSKYYCFDSVEPKSRNPA